MQLASSNEQLSMRFGGCEYGRAAGHRYTVAHDVSARDWQLERNGGQWLMGKTLDTFAPIGPAIVTTDELPDIHEKGIRCRLNGETVQDSSTKQLVFDVPTIVEWVSAMVTLLPGDLIFTGTPPGVGCFRKPQLWLKAGDVVEVEIDGIGCISNPVKDEVIE
jgi:2-keto-4-pentenoate hydratase/2-oxohepta-3-ene-1,7-dioic acid hydratase in catechol pathway